MSDLSRVRQKYVFVPYRELAYVIASHEKLRQRELKKKNDVMMNAMSDITTTDQENEYMHYENALCGG